MYNRNGKNNPSYRHGKCRTGIYECWLNMRRRCGDPKNKSYPNYGGRGIKVCDRWLNSFENFLEDMGERPDGYTIDRINNDLGYSPENCRWASRLAQMNNQSTNKVITHNGKTYTLGQWAYLSGCPRKRLWARLRDGWTLERALTTPLKEVKR